METRREKGNFNPGPDSRFARQRGLDDGTLQYGHKNPGGGSSANWFNHARGIVTQDCVLPESFKACIERDRDKVVQVGVKLINYDEGRRRNFLIKPVQILGITEYIGDELIMKCFSAIKCFKSAFGVDVKSYLIKKIILTDEMKGKIAKNGEENWQESVFEVLKHPELIDSFNRNAAFNKWKKLHTFHSLWFELRMDETLDNTLPKRQIRRMRRKNRILGYQDNSQSGIM